MWETISETRRICADFIIKWYESKGSSVSDKKNFKDKLRRRLSPPILRIIGKTAGDQGRVKSLMNLKLKNLKHIKPTAKDIIELFFASLQSKNQVEDASGTSIKKDPQWMTDKNEEDLLQTDYGEGMLFSYGNQQYTLEGILILLLSKPKEFTTSLNTFAEKKKEKRKENPRSPMIDDQAEEAGAEEVTDDDDADAAGAAGAERASSSSSSSSSAESSVHSSLHSGTSLHSITEKYRGLRRTYFMTMDYVTKLEAKLVELGINTFPSPLDEGTMVRKPHFLGSETLCSQLRKRGYSPPQMSQPPESQSNNNKSNNNKRKRASTTKAAAAAKKAEARKERKEKKGKRERKGKKERKGKEGKETTRKKKSSGRKSKNGEEESVISNENVPLKNLVKKRKRVSSDSDDEDEDYNPYEEDNYDYDYDEDDEENQFQG